MRWIGTITKAMLLIVAGAPLLLADEIPPDQRRSGFNPRIVNQRENALRQACIGNSFLHDFRNQLTRSRVRRVRFHNHRAAGGKR